MQNTAQSTDINEIDAKAGAKPQGVRIVLLASLLLAIIVMTLVWVVPALS